MTWRTTFGGGLSGGFIGLISTAMAASPVINEIHYDPPDRTERAEFVELHNPGTAPVDLSGWRLRGGVDFDFPAGSTLAAGGYLVVAEDPATITRKYGVASVGPWSGRLGNGGETITLNDATGAQADRVRFQLGFPWPVVGEAPGYSIELVHPALDNELGGHWRPSVAGGSAEANREVLIPAGATWKLWRGRAEPSSPADAWRTAGYSDSAWETAVLPAGYDADLPMGTPLDDMRGQYSSFYLRTTVTVSDPGTVSQLEIDARFDDGFRVWVNGRDVLGVNVPGGELAFDSLASATRESADSEPFQVNLPAGVLKAGENVVAVQVLNVSLGASSDAFFDARMTAVRGPTGVGPTPGRRNIVFAEVAPPALQQVAHAPEQPSSGTPVTITALVRDPDGVESVTLDYQAVSPGAYIELTDPLYRTAWESLPMKDDGVGADTQAGDGIYSVVLPGSVQVHRQLVRYRIRAADRGGTATTAPYPDDPVPNFAYFVYDGVPAWTGALRPGATGEAGRVFTVPAEEMNRLPVLHLIGRKSTVETSTWFSRYGGDAYPWLGTLVFNGRVYDHVRHRARGGVWRYAMGKNMWKFDFARGHDFQAVDDWGRPYDTTWTKLNLGACIQQGDFQHRGEQGMFESVGFRVFRLAGVPAVHSTHVQFRVIDDAEEAPTSQYDGDFWGVYLMLEQPDGRFVEQHGLPDGNLYKMEGGWGELNHLGRAGPSDSSDLAAFLSEYNTATEEWWRSRFDVASYLSYQTVVQAIHHYDICYDKNFFYFRSAEDGRWSVVPWDLDLTWAENMFDAGCGGVDRIKERLLPNATRHPAVWREWQNRIREFRDLFWNDQEAARLIREQASLLRGTAAGPTLLDADRAQWDYNPLMVNDQYVSSGSGKAGWGKYYQFPSYPAAQVSRNFDGVVQLMTRYVGFRATNAAARARSLDAIATDPQVPARPSVAYRGPRDFPANGLRFAPTSTPASGSSVRWRLGEVADGVPGRGGEPGRYEIETVWESGPLSLAAAEVTVPADAVSVGRRYRARMQTVDAEGRASRWSEAVEFVPTAFQQAESLEDSLRVTELMYNSHLGATNDYLEIHHAGTVALSLEGCAFASGITFTFPAGATIQPGEYILVVRAAAAGDFAAFRAANNVPAGVKIFGPYSGNFSDTGERVVLQTPGGTDDIIDITYSDGSGWPMAADGGGHSLVPVKDFGTAANAELEYGRNWRASAYIGGSPGAADPVIETEVVLNEIVAHTDLFSSLDSNDWIELYRPADTPFVFGEGWYLSDSRDTPKRWAIPAGRTVPARGWLTFDEVSDFHPSETVGFGLNKAGEEVVISYFPPGGGPGRIVDGIAFTGQENEAALARVPDGAPDWDNGVPRSRGAANLASAPRIHFSEIWFNGGGAITNSLGADQLEFLELHNPLAEPVKLYNTNAVWRISGGITFDLPLFFTLQPGERLVIVPFDPAVATSTARFRQAFSIPATVRIVGPYTGGLNNETDHVALERAQEGDPAGTPVSWVVVDEVTYFDRTPWPTGADGTGQSYHRQDGTLPGVAPGNWRAAAPTPGAAPPAGNPDSDNDGMPDAWETQYGLNPQDPADAAQDRDGDRATNLAEYQAGTDPTNPADVLALAVTNLGTGVRLSFTATNARAYVVESAASLPANVWETVQTVPAGAGSRPITVDVPASSLNAGSEFWRVRLAAP